MATRASKSSFITDLREPKEPRILLWDIETAPILARVWGAWDQNFIWKEEDWHLLSIAWKWLGEDEVHVCGLDDFVGYKDNPEDDYSLVYHAWDLFNEADIVVAHNGVSFDTKKAQARMIIHGFDPPSPFVEIDTLKLAKESFAFTKNRLDDVAQDLGIGEKLQTGGHNLWRSVLGQDPEAWETMKEYNRQDVILLEALYLRLRAWAKKHPNLATISDKPDACPICGDTKKGMVIRGYRHTQVSVRVSYRCNNCGSYCSGRKIHKTETQYLTAA